MVLFMLVAGGLGLVPTAFLLRLLAGAAPRALLAAEMLIAAAGPVSWLLVVGMAKPPDHPVAPTADQQMLGLLIAFVAIPRIVVGPVLLVVEAATALWLRGRLERALLAAAMATDIIPLGLFALHMSQALRR